MSVASQMLSDRTFERSTTSSTFPAHTDVHLGFASFVLFVDLADVTVLPDLTDAEVLLDFPDAKVLLDVVRHIEIFEPHLVLLPVLLVRTGDVIVDLSCDIAPPVEWSLSLATMSLTCVPMTLSLACAPRAIGRILKNRLTRATASFSCSPSLWPAATRSSTLLTGP
mmetsp:Transcript_105719/g.298800  ORF Transcript_105719/g.298800 Transcript_105719/m.298800 type:complete len:167 (+) Transcript_105719:96-596(+)